MLPSISDLVSQVVTLQHETVKRWHHCEVDNPFEGFEKTVCQQHQFNFLLWHEEDIARSPNVGDARIANVKRAIDGYNQNRNDWIEKLDLAILDRLRAASVSPQTEARLNTETPGSVIDRLSIQSLRIYHLKEQLERTDATAAHLATVQERIARCELQHADLANSLCELLEDLFAGRKLLKTYRQMKMYNDPTMNPYLYQNRTQKAA